MTNKMITKVLFKFLYVFFLRVLWIRGVRPSGSCRDVMPNYGQTTNLFTFCNFFCFTCKQKYYLPNRFAVENWVELPFKNPKSVQAFQSYSWKHEIFSFFVVFVIVVKMSKNGLIQPFLHQKLISWWQKLYFFVL